MSRGSSDVDPGDDRRADIAACLKKLDAWQRGGLRWMLTAEAREVCGEHPRGRGLVLADRMGSGKTHQVSALLALSTPGPVGAAGPPAPALVICPTANIIFWRDAIRWMTGHPPFVLVPGCSASVVAGPGEVVLAPHSFFKTPHYRSLQCAAHVDDLAGVAWSRVVIDEAHRLGAYGWQRLEALRAAVRWALCGCDAAGRVPARFGDVLARMEAQPEDVLVRRGAPSTIAERTVTLAFRSEAERRLYARVADVRATARNPSEATLRCRQLCADVAVFRRAVELQAFCGSQGEVARACAAVLRETLADPEAAFPRAGTKAHYILDRLRDPEAADDRFLVVVTWNAEIDSLLEFLAAEGVPVAALTAKMRLDEQDAVLSSFALDADVPDAPRALLVTADMCGAGLNLQSANHVIVTAPQRDTFKEAQAGARVDRKGRDNDRPVTVTRILIEGTLEA